VSDAVLTDDGEPAVRVARAHDVRYRDGHHANLGTATEGIGRNALALVMNCALHECMGIHTRGCLKSSRWLTLMDNSAFSGACDTLLRASDTRRNEHQ